jgi:eukaryotic-like serine/threonine-protein kinase
MKKNYLSIIAFLFVLAGVKNIVANNNMIVWKFPTGKTVYASPLIYNDVVYIGSLDSNFYAIDSKTGIEKWHYKTDNAIFSTATIYQDALCFESGDQLYSLNLNGELMWKFLMYAGPIANQYDEWDYFHSSPQLVDSIAYIGTETGLVFGINMKTGQQTFQCQTPCKNWAIHTTPAIYHDMIFFGDWDGVMYAYNLTTAEKIWEYDTKTENANSWKNAIQTNPVIFNDALYFAGRSCVLYSLNPNNGSKNWSFKDPSSMWLLGGPTIADSVIYLGSSNQHFLQSFDALTGQKKWTTMVDYRIFGIPLVNGDKVYFGTGNEVNEKLGSIFALDRQTGKMKSRYSFTGQIHSSLTLDDGTIYFGCGDGCVYAVDQQVFSSMQFPNTGFKNTTTFNIGELPTSVAQLDTSLYIYNTGDAMDSIKVALTMASTLRKYLVLGQSRFQIAAHDSLSIPLTIYPSQLSPKAYSAVINVTSKYNLEKNSITRGLKFTVVQSTTIEPVNPDSPRQFSLEQNYPNPFNPKTFIHYSIAEKCVVDLTIYNVLGEAVITLDHGEKPIGSYQVMFDAANVSSGIYFYQLTAGDNVFIKKMMLLY